MKRYISLLSARFRLLLQYRVAAIAGFGTQLFFGLVRVMIFTAFYAASTHPQPMSLAQVVTYVWLGQALLIMLPWNVDNDVRDMIRTGNVAYELTRPLDLYWTWFTRAVALRVAPGVLRAVPMFILAIAFLHMQLPPSLAAGAAFALSLVLAVLLAAAITTFCVVTVMWTIAGEGVSRLLPSVALLLSGLVIPLPLFPAWSRWYFRLQPFSGVFDHPFRLYTGNIPVADTGWVLLHQAGWTLAFVLAGRWLVARGLQRLVVQGG
jgi:ABC-2 type transport system permease protein